MAMRAATSFAPGLIFFIVFYVVSFYMLYNLFIGVILEEFELTDDEKQGLQLGNFRVHVLKELRRRQSAAVKLDRLSMFTLRRKRSLDDVAQLPSAAPGDGPGGGGAEGQTGADMEPAGGSAVREGEGGGRAGMGGGVEGGVRGDDEGLGQAVLPCHQEAGRDVTICGCFPPATPNPLQPDAPTNLRGIARHVAQDPWFERGILLTILVSAIFLAMQSPVRCVCV